MELLYVWIEKYKNIEKQGFNFSPRYRFQFNPATNELTQPGKNEVIENFFGDRISNVTAIIGENGSGKSNLLEAIMVLIDHFFSINSTIKSYEVDIDIINMKFVVVFFNDNIFTNISNLKYKSDIIEIFNKTEKKIQCIFYSNVFDFKYGLKFQFVNDVSTNKLLKNTKKSSLNKNYSNEEFTKLLDYFEKFSPIHGYSFSILLQTPFKDYKVEQLISYFEKYDKVVDNKTSNLYIDNIEFFKKQVDNVKITDLNHAILLKILCQRVINPDIYNKKKDKKLHYIEGAKYLDLCENIIKLQFLDIRELKDFFIHNKEAFDEITMNLFKFLISETINNFNNYKWEFNLEISIKNIRFIKQLLEISGNKKLFDIKFTGISSGELALANIFSRLLSVNPIYKNIIVLIDEGELGFHPQWQKEYLKNLVDVLPKIFEDKQIQLILTSHSPFLCSDMPKENMIFLRRGEEIEKLADGSDAFGKCIVSDLDRKQTFGANIHTLFTDSFFLKDGLIGDFAKGKIEQIKKFIKGELSEIKSKEECLLIINMIGEPILRTTLQRMYSDAFPEKKHEIIEYYKSEIKRLENGTND
jgi:predicted ATP-dependent endonuclease of OLD family